MPLTHPKAPLFANINLFADIKTFEELEKRISALSSDIERGDAFEVFAEAYLLTQPLIGANNVWPGNNIPLDIAQNLGVNTPRDMGIDGMFESPTHGRCAYQVKFRTDRPSLTWREISTFMGLTDRVGARMLFTNSEELPDVINDRSLFFCIRGNDLDKLEENDFESISALITGMKYERKHKTPLPHQEEAISNIISDLDIHDRTTAIMACGTGKTLIALWTAERMGAKNILVLVPSLALMSQTLREWIKETSWRKYAYLSVCSDSTVEKDLDSIIVKQSELSFPVTTNSYIVKAFLNSPFDGTKIVFSTYHSLKTISNGIPSGFSYDFAIFDEAHKTAGHKEKAFASALKNKGVSIKKRLFMTATPRHYDIKWRNKLGDPKSIYSMDDTELYGLYSYKLSFRNACEKGIICKYKIVVSVVTSEMVEEEVIRRGDVLIEGDILKAHHVANQIALVKAIELHKTNKVISFHPSVKEADSFASKGPDGITTHMPSLNSFHVNGKMPSSTRERTLNHFKGRFT